MTQTLREIGAGSVLVKLRQRTSQPMTFRSGKEDRTTIVEEHVQFQADTWKEVGDGVAIRFAIPGDMTITVLPDDIFAVFAQASKVI